MNKEGGIGEVPWKRVTNDNTNTGSNTIFCAEKVTAQPIGSKGPCKNI